MGIGEATMGIGEATMGIGEATATHATRATLPPGPGSPEP